MELAELNKQPALQGLSDGSMSTTVGWPVSSNLQQPQLRELHEHQRETPFTPLRLLTPFMDWQMHWTCRSAPS